MATAAPPVRPDAARTTPRAPRRTGLLLALAIAQTVVGGTTFPAVAVLLTPISEALDATRAQVMGASTAALLAGALVAVPVGRLLDRHGGRAVMTTGAAAVALLLTACAGAHDLPQLYLGFLLLGGAQASIGFESTYAVVVSTLGPRQRDRGLLIISTVTGLGTTLFYPVTVWLEDGLGWRGALLALAALQAAVSVPLLALNLPGRSTHRRRIAQRRGMDVAAALRTPSFWLLTLCFVGQAGAGSTLSLLSVSWFLDLGHPAAVAAVLPITLGVLQVLSRLALVPLAPLVGMPTLAVCANVVQAAAMVSLPFTGTSIGPTMLCLAGAGLGMGVGALARPSVIASTYGAVRFATILGLMTIAMSASRALFPLLGATLDADHAMLLCAILSAVGALSLFPVARAARTRGEYESS
ncbi:MFS transporter [Nocardioides yefusunii]|uniref:MFS transporter n=1 Tax=Nocardioides yefusunii TaxID=2500546 RepID=A0ABW1QXI8_9ACTN|nr:MFS transporter [Nocardioides yefusunii]